MRAASGESFASLINDILLYKKKLYDAGEMGDKDSWGDGKGAQGLFERSEEVLHHISDERTLKIALQMCNDSARAGCADAVNRLGEHHQRGAVYVDKITRGRVPLVKKNPAKALRAFEAAIQLKPPSAKAIFNLASLLYDGAPEYGVEKDRETALAMFQDAATLGSPHAKVKIAEMTRDGSDGFEPRAIDAVKLLFSVVKNKDLDLEARSSAVKILSSLVDGKWLEPGSKSVALTEERSRMQMAVALVRRARLGAADFVMRGHHAHMHKLFNEHIDRPDCAYFSGVMHEQGLGVEADNAAAKALYYRAANGGYADAKYSFARLEMAGSDVNYDLAYKFLLDAARSSHPLACQKIYTLFASTIRDLPSPEDLKAASAEESNAGSNDEREDEVEHHSFYNFFYSQGLSSEEFDIFGKRAFGRLPSSKPRIPVDGRFDLVEKYSAEFERYSRDSLTSSEDMYNLGLCHYYGFGTLPNEMMAVSCFSRSVEMGRVQDIDWISTCYPQLERRDVIHLIHNLDMEFVSKNLDVMERHFISTFEESAASVIADIYDPRFTEAKEAIIDNFDILFKFWEVRLGNEAAIENAKNLVERNVIIPDLQDILLSRIGGLLEMEESFVPHIERSPLAARSEVDETALADVERVLSELGSRVRVRDMSRKLVSADERTRI